MFLTKLENKYYTSIEDLPVYNWWKLHEKQDFKYLLKSKRYKVDDRAEKVLESLQSEFIKTFGIDENYAQYLRKQIEIELLKIKLAKTKDNSLKTFIEILEVELQDLTVKEEGKSIQDSSISVEKWLGFKLDTKKVSTFEYYSYIKAIERAIKSKK